MEKIKNFIKKEFRVTKTTFLDMLVTIGIWELLNYIVSLIIK